MSNGNGLRLNQSMVEEEDFNPLTGDALTEVVDGLPLIQFLEIVHALIHKRMAKTIVIKLLVKFQDDDDYSKLMVEGLRMTTRFIECNIQEEFAQCNW
ncbi:hypothetical protein CXB51_007044 [Gossypium anomalum]|uniref:Uncharacterized protein n=1 Tax=Gossypium anomalum TaxID=47600 RepID=A0A8J5Z182_9ROSI|nr:hypothetical protein CXB51_007044 [Gossypium anomalum]